MIHSFFTTLFVIACIFMVLIILVQKGKGSMGLGSLGGSNQMLFGGSGGQDLFQKITWALVIIFLGGSLLLSILKKPNNSLEKYASKKPVPSKQINR